MTNDLLKLNLGSGPFPMDGYVNLDRKNGNEVYPLSYPDESVEEIRASHILEHFSHRETVNVLKHWVSKLKPGGVLKVSVPDLKKIAEWYLCGVPFQVQGYLMGGHSDSDDQHGAAFDMEALCEAFHEAGLERVRIWQSDNQDTSASNISLNLMGYKPSAPRIEFSGVRACLASARYGPGLHHKCIYDALYPLKIPMHMSVGCFWNQHLSESIEGEIAHEDCRYILTLDFDTIFSAAEVVELYRILETHPHIDALVSCQSKRGGADAALFTMSADAPTLVEGEVDARIFDRLTVPIATGHFGLTMFRADKLRALPRPWMQAQPNADGRWGDGRIDADIAFWLNWKAAGNTVHLANRVGVGHIEDVVMWPSQDFTPHFQRPADYMTTGKPAEAR